MPEVGSSRKDNSPDLTTETPTRKQGPVLNPSSSTPQPKGSRLHTATPAATLKDLSAFLRQVRLLLATVVPMLAYAITTLWEHFGH